MAKTMADLKKFFSTPEKPLGNTEFIEFWKSCTDDQKKEYLAELNS